MVFYCTLQNFWITAISPTHPYFVCECVPFSDPFDERLHSFTGSSASEVSGMRRTPSVATLNLMEKISGAANGNGNGSGSLASWGAAAQAQAASSLADSSAGASSLRRSGSNGGISGSLAQSAASVPQSSSSAAAASAPPPQDEKDINLIRERLEKLLTSLVKVLRDDAKEVGARFKSMLALPSGFFWDGAYANQQVLRLLAAPHCALILESGTGACGLRCE